MANSTAAAGSGPVIDIAEVLDAQPVTSFNIMLIVIGWFAIFADGFDIANIGYIMPNLMRELHLGSETVGLVSSASLIAYPIGALILGWVSDHHGRKLALIIGCLVVSIFTYATMFVHSAEGLAAMRFLTGCGLGGVIPNIVALGSEFAPKRVRARLIIFTFCGINFGGFVCGLVAPAIIHDWGWRGLFFVGGTVPLLAVILMWAFMPESVKFLALNGRRDAELRRILARLIPSLNVPPNARFQVASQTQRVPFRFGQLFAGPLLWITPILWAMFILNFITLYFAGSWTNIVLQQSGVPQTQAILVSSLNQGGGVLGGLVISYFVDRWGFKSVIAWGILTAATVWMIGIPGLQVGWIAVWVAISGFGMQGVQYGLNATPGMIYPTSFRAFGAGWAFSVSRLGAVAGPIIGGVLLAMYQAQGLAKAQIAQNMFLFPVLPLVIGIVLAIVAAVLVRHYFHGDQFEEQTQATAAAE
ncbi:MAG TPA: MFS transporter [Hyphomicrobiales bacterium]|nr:MFS transporter [Hyphomicrobiales bacterium]